MPLLKCCALGRFLAAMALVGYLIAAGEQFVPDRHDWHAVTTSVLAATPAVPAGHSTPAPAHPVHVCHDGHQHTVGPVVLSRALKSTGMPSAITTTPQEQQSSPPPHSFFRPPIA